MPAGKPVSANVQLTEELIDRMEKAKAMLMQMARMHEDSKWYTWLLPELKNCVENTKHSRLRHLFRSYPVKKLQSVPLM
jgi:hypothetical protein